MRWLVFAAGLYLIAPGHPDLPLGGLPLGQTGTIVLILLIGAYWWSRHAAASVRPSFLIAAVAAIALKVALAVLVPITGWQATYYANDMLSGPGERSLDFLSLDATRIDRDLAFANTEFPVYFFNEHRFNFGFRREATEPFSIRWQGHLHSESALVLELESRGDASVVVDDVTVAGPRIELAPGTHQIDVSYRKPKDTEGLFRLAPIGHDGVARRWEAGEVTPVEAAPGRRALAAPSLWLAWLLHLVMAMVVAIALVPALRATVRDSVTLGRTSPLAAAHVWVGPIVIGALMAQGAFQSRRLVGQVWTLTGGDDWLAFEMNARDALLRGLLMTRGAEVGVPYFEYPGYGYFLALVHRLTGESLAGVVLVNFLLLGAATLLAYGIARRVVGQTAALAALAWLLVLEQLDFVRYYTVTLLSENLFFPAVALTIFLLVRYLHEGRWWLLAWGGVMGGLASATRPTMMLFLPAALLVITVSRWRLAGVTRLLAGAVVFGVCWMAAIGPFTLRNYIVSGSPVLITAGQARTFIDYNVPSGTANDKYYAAFTGSMLSSAKTLLCILYDHPGETLATWGTKASFGLGMVHLYGTSKPHPELVITSLLYLVGMFWLRNARTGPAMLVHTFVLTHLSTLLLTQPANYGYRLVLAMYLFMPIFSAAVVLRLGASARASVTASTPKPERPRRQP